jgi:hypothetical protein
MPHKETLAPDSIGIGTANELVFKQDTSYKMFGRSWQ